MCLSGDIVEQDDEKQGIIDEAIAAYKKAVPVIRDGKSHRVGTPISSYTIPGGWQALIREGKKTDETMIVFHAFDREVPASVEFDLPAGRYEILWDFKPKDVSCAVEDGTFRISGITEHMGCVVMLKSQ